MDDQKEVPQRRSGGADIGESPEIEGLERSVLHISSEEIQQGETNRGELGRGVVGQ